MFLSYAGGFAETVAELADYEKAGLDIVFVPEAYSFDAVSQLGFLAAKTERMQIASGILQLYSRTPALTAMTAAGLDYVSGGRFTLGLGASGPQVIEGWHGVPYDAPIGRAREIIEICRMVWRRERLAYQGRYYPLPLEEGTGLGKPLKLINHPVRERIPIAVAAIGPQNVALAAELAEGWMPIFYVPERPGRCGASRWPRAPPSASPARPLDVIAAPGWRSATTSPACAITTGRSSPCTSAGWARGAATSTTTWPSGSATRPRRGDPGRLPGGRKDEAEALVPADLVGNLADRPGGLRAGAPGRDVKLG